MVSIDIVADLASRSFSKRSGAEKDAIVKGGRPCPELVLVSTDSANTSQRKKGMELTKTVYEDIEWLTVSVNLGKLFCWPCLLFLKQNKLWNKNGFSDFDNFQKFRFKHESCTSHMMNYIRVRLWEKVLGNQSHTAPVAETKDYYLVEEVLKRGIDAICYQAVYLSFDPNSSDPIFYESYWDLLNMLRKFDSKLETHLKSASSDLVFYPSVKSRLTEAIVEVMRDEVIKELSEASAASLILTELSDTSTKSEVSVIVRYVHKGDVKQRFIGFTELSLPPTSDSAFTVLKDLTNHLKIGPRLIGYSFNGSLLPVIEMNTLIAKMNAAFKTAIFSPSEAQPLSTCLLESLRFMPQCNSFYKHLLCLTDMLNNPQVKRHFEEFISQRSTEPKIWDFSNRLAYSVLEIRHELSAFLSVEILHCPENWDSLTVLKAGVLHSFLSQDKTVFLLKMFSKISVYTDFLYSGLQSPKLDVVQIIKDVENVIDQLWKETSFTDDPNTKTGEPSSKKMRIGEAGDVHQKIANSVVDDVCRQLKLRFSHLKKLELFSLMAQQTESDVSLPLETIKQGLGESLDYSRLRNELTFLNSSSDFVGKGPREVLRSIWDNDLTHVLRETLKLGEILMALPLLSTDGDSAHARVLKFWKKAGCEQRHSSSSFLLIEKPHLASICNEFSFKDKVLSKFHNKVPPSSDVDPTPIINLT